MCRPSTRSHRRRTLGASRGRAPAARAEPISGTRGARPPARLDVRRVEAVEQVPEDLGLPDQGGDASGLQLVRVGVAHHEVDRLERVLPRARRARPEVLEGVAADPRVVALPRQHATGHQIGREELGERRCHGLEQRALPHQLDVPVAREAHAGEDRAAARHLPAVEAHALGQPEPQLEPALARRVAVVIPDASNPHPPERRIFRLRQDDRVLDRHARLVVVAVQHPLLELELRELPVVHQDVIPVVVVVAVLALAADPLDELVAGERRPLAVLAHSLTSMPSQATSQPAASTRARSGESSRSSGFVLFRWMKIRRFAPSPLNRARLPSGPPTGTWAMSSARLTPSPCAGSSSLNQNVPSKKTQSASSIARRTASVTAPAAETYARTRPVAGSRIRKPTLSSGSGRAPPSRWIGSLPGTATASTRSPEGCPSTETSASSRPIRSACHVTWPGKRSSV